MGSQYIVDSIIDWADENYEPAVPEYDLREYCVCPLYGEPGCSYGIGAYECISASEQASVIIQRLHKLISRTDYEEAAQMAHVYRGTILEDIANWSVFIRENIDELNGIGFLPHWDVCSFSGVVFEKKTYSRAELIDLLTVPEETVLWIYNDK